jgi:Bacterial PH domain
VRHLRRRTPTQAFEREVEPVANEYVKGQLAAGEVLLIDTRQHWIAALRFAIRPLVVAGLAVLLSLLNQWLQFDRLGFINDLLHWLILIAFVVAIVWLPIDLFRWWSRHFVLTNRRAMRMDGVLRKQSFDSSLEQINDIMLSQSVLGRQLGYADLTLLTANSSNEAYEQLLDGPQFKKAVLDAKEAIRLGHPLQALPDGFVVKGGTNEASQRASRKSPDEAAAAGAAATATVVTTAAGTMGFEEPETAPVKPRPATPPVEDTGSAEVPSVTEVMAEDEAFAEWPAPVEADTSTGTQAVDAEAWTEAQEVVAADTTPSEVAVEPDVAIAPEEAVADEPFWVAPETAEATPWTEPEPVADVADDAADATDEAAADPGSSAGEERTTL